MTPGLTSKTQKWLQIFTRFQTDFASVRDGCVWFFFSFLFFVQMNKLL